MTKSVPHPSCHPSCTKVEKLRPLALLRMDTRRYPERKQDSTLHQLPERQGAALASETPLFATASKSHSLASHRFQVLFAVKEKRRQPCRARLNHVPFFIHTAKFEQRGVFRIGAHGTLVPCIRQRHLLALDGVAQLARKNRRRFTRSRRPMRAWLWAWNLIPERRARVHVVATMRLLRKRLMH